MTNRKDRRAEKAAAPRPPAIPNVTGTAECCGNCACAPPRIPLDKNRRVRGVNPMPDDEVSCMLNPGGGINMKVWGWCAQWRLRAL